MRGRGALSIWSNPAVPRAVIPAVKWQGFFCFIHLSCSVQKPHNKFPERSKHDSGNKLMNKFPKVVHEEWSWKKNLHRTEFSLIKEQMEFAIGEKKISLKWSQTFQQPPWAWNVFIRDEMKSRALIQQTLTEPTFRRGRLWARHWGSDVSKVLPGPRGSPSNRAGRYVGFGVSRSLSRRTPGEWGNLRETLRVCSAFACRVRGKGRPPQAEAAGREAQRSEPAGSVGRP